MPLTPVLAASAGHADLLFGLFVIFIAAKLAAELFERLRQPAVVGEILAGVVIGPSVLGWVATNEVTAALSEIGVILLLFTVGLEVKPRAIFQVGAMAMLVAVAGVVLPFLAGWGLMAWWGTPTIENVFIGAAMVATSVGITARVLAAKGLLQTKVSQIILGAAVIDDILGLMVLSVVAGLAESGGIHYAELATTAALSIGFTVFMLFVGVPVATRVLPSAGRLRIGNPYFIVALAICLGLSWLATQMNVAPIIGAFLAGMALSEAGEEAEIHHEVSSVMEFLVPFFLVGIGLQLDLAVFGDPGVMLLTVMITVIAVLTKLLGCGVASLSLGVRKAAQIGMGMVPRGEVGIIVAQIGLGLGVLSASIYGVIVFMAVATTLIAPPFLSLLFRGEAVDECEPGSEVVDRDEVIAGID
jgi:Kef-type K+ transport system membrane component KefB